MAIQWHFANWHTADSGGACSVYFSVGFYMKTNEKTPIDVLRRAGVGGGLPIPRRLGSGERREFSNVVRGGAPADNDFAHFRRKIKMLVAFNISSSYSGNLIMGKLSVFHSFSLSEA